MIIQYMLKCDKDILFQSHFNIVYLYVHRTAYIIQEKFKWHMLPVHLVAFGRNWCIQYNHKIHWARCARICRHDHHWEASLLAYSAMSSHCFLSFLSYCQRIKWCLIPHAKAFLQTNHWQTEKAIRQMQLEYKENACL